MAENNLGNTQYFRTKPDQELEVKEVLDLVYNAMDEKGYNPVNQIVGYIMSGDPTYITSHKGARSMIMKVERDELVEELLQILGTLVCGFLDWIMDLRQSAWQSVTLWD